MIFWAAAAMLLCAVNLQAQDNQARGERPTRPEGMERPEREAPMTDAEYAVKRTAEMVEKYGLTEEQEKQVLSINQSFASRLNPSGQMQEMGDPREMSDEEREEFFANMQERMSQMQAQRVEREKALKEYDKIMKTVLDKKQMKAYKKDRTRENAAARENQQGMGGFPGGMGGPGGFGGPPGGGFGGGGFGGPGGFGGGF